MTPEQLIAEVEALDKSATHGPWIAGELGTNDAGVIRDSYQDFIGESDGNRWQENTQLIARFRTLAPELAQHCKELQAAVDRLTAERDQAVARNAFLHNETGKALEIALFVGAEARAELARLTTLRPIEEAPKDGTSMLCWCPGYGWRHLYWDHVWLLVGAPCDEYEPTQFLSLPVKP